MSVDSLKLPNEIIIKIINNLDSETLQSSLSQIPFLKQLVTLNISDIDDPEKIIENDINGMTITDFIKKEIDIDSLFSVYHFFVLDIHKRASLDNMRLYYKTHKILIKLKKLNKPLIVNYWDDAIDLTYLKMFKSCLYMVPDESTKYQINFHNLTTIKCNSNHLLIKPFVSFVSLKTLNLYYCSPNFYFQVFNFLNLEKNSGVFPSLKNLKIQDYMSEAEDAYSITSDNHIRDAHESDYDDYDCNSDMDENEFFFDGLEIVQNVTLTKLERLTLKSCNISLLKNVTAKQLTHLKLLELSSKHTDAYDLNLITNDDDDKIEEDSYEQSFLNSSISTKLKVSLNQFPSLRSLKIIGHLKLESLDRNGFGLDNSNEDEVIIKCSNVEIKSFPHFVDSYNSTNSIGAV